MTRTLTDPLVALQRAQYAALTGDATLQAIGASGVEIFDRVSDASFPYGVIGEDREAPDDNEYGTASEIFSTVRFYSRAVGKLQAKAMAGRARYVLDKQNGFTIDGFRVLAGHCTDVKIHIHQDRVTTQAELTFRYLVQPG